MDTQGNQIGDHQRERGLSELEFKQLLVDQFPTVPVPGLSELAPGAYPDALRLNQMLAGMHWNELAVPDLRGVAPDLVLLPPASFRYYIPAFLLFTFRSEDEDAVYFVVSALQPPTSSLRDGPTRDAADWQRKRLRAFSPSQCAVIHEYLCLALADDPEDSGILSYWRERSNQ